MIAWQKDLEDAEKLKNGSQSPETEKSDLKTRISSCELKLNKTENLVKFQSSLLTKANKFGFKIIFWARSAIWTASFWKPWTGNGGINDGESNAQRERTYDSSRPAQELTITKWKALDWQ